MPTVRFDDLSVHEKRRLVVRAALRTIITVALVVAVYFLVPMDRAISQRQRPNWCSEFSR